MSIWLGQHCVIMILLVVLVWLHVHLFYLQQIKAAERYEKRLEFHLARVSINFFFRFFFFFFFFFFVH